jgi:2-polyprenyl-3-methyl-5-hydroxy-6-metoxy-1,4-benzoquinol methylase
MDESTRSQLTEAWPAAELEAVPTCPVCDEPAREPWLEGLTDLIFHAAPGRWALWRCRSCSAARLDPRPTPASIGRAYNRYYTHASNGEGPARHFIVPGDRPDLRLKRALHLSFYNHAHGHQLPDALPLGWLAVAASRWRSVRAGHYIRHLPGPRREGARLLDVGCGDGGFLRVAQAMGYRAQGIEFDAAAAAPAQRAGFDVRIGAIEDADFEPASFDQVVLSHVIEHLHDPVLVLRRLLGWMRPGARLWLQTPNIDSRGVQRYGVHWRGLEPPRHLVMFNERSLRLACERAGFGGVALLPPQLDAQFFIGQSEAMQRGEDPYAIGATQRRAARRLGRQWDRDAMANPLLAESLTMVAFKPAAA